VKTFEIRSRYDAAKILYCGEHESLKEAVEAAVKSGDDLSGADLSGADLSWANLSEANLCRANLSEANLYRADLSWAKNAELILASTSICPEGQIIGWKKCKGGVIVKLSIPEDARRSNATGRKCRAEFADVLEIFSGGSAVSLRDGNTVYRVGERVIPHEWCEDRWQECAGGIHFYITREEAEAHS